MSRIIRHFIIRLLVVTVLDAVVEFFSIRDLLPIFAANCFDAIDIDEARAVAGPKIVLVRLPGTLSPGPGRSTVE